MDCYCDHQQENLSSAASVWWHLTTGVVIAASYWGKVQDNVPDGYDIALMIANIEALSVLTTIVMWVALVLTVVSLVDYLMKNKDVLKDQH